MIVVTCCEPNCASGCEVQAVRTQITYQVDRLLWEFAEQTMLAEGQPGTPDGQPLQAPFIAARSR